MVNGRHLLIIVNRVRMANLTSTSRIVDADEWPCEG